MTWFTCPEGTKKLDDSTECGYECAPGLDVFTNNDTYCVPTLCPAGTTQDLGDNSLCIKGTPTTKTPGGDCLIGFTEWTPTKCYADCPPQYRENGTSCIKTLSKRRTTGIDCGVALFTWNGSYCEPNFYLKFFVVFLFVFVPLLSILVYAISSSRKVVSKCAPPVPPLVSAPPVSVSSSLSPKKA